MVDKIKMVRFDWYCETCVHFSKTEDEMPCAACLAQAGRENSHKPICYEEDEKKVKHKNDSKIGS